MPVRFPKLHLQLFFFSFVLYSLPAQAAKWTKVNSPHYEIICRETFIAQAQRVASTFEYLHPFITQSLGKAPRKLPILLDSQNMNQNAMFIHSPKRIMFYYNFPQVTQITGPVDWIDLLVLHEYRHAVQHVQLNEMWLNRYVYRFIGPVLDKLQAPEWLFEGDAVCTETALTPGGRGRIPAFSAPYRANLLSGKRYTYDQQLLGSFKHHTLNAYQLGYYFTTFLRRNYGADIVTRLLHRAAKAVIAPFDLVSKRETGCFPGTLYHKMEDELLQLWKKQIQDLPITPAQSVPHKAHGCYTDYIRPQLLAPGAVLALRKGMNTLPQFVVLRQGCKHPEKVLCTPSQLNEQPLFHAQNHMLVWAEQRYHPTFEGQQTVDLYTYNYKTGKKKLLVRKGRYQAPVLSPDGRYVAAVHLNDRYEQTLVVLHADTGRVYKSWPTPTQHHYHTPTWHPSGQLLLVVDHHQQKLGFTKIDLSTGKKTPLLPPSHHNILFPAATATHLFYTADYNGIDNIYALDLATRECFQVTSRKFGATQATPTPDGKTLYFSEITCQGMRVMRMPIVPKAWTPLEQVQDRSIRYYEPLVQQEKSLPVLDEIPLKRYPTQRYHKWLHFFNFYQLLLWPFDLETMTSQFQLKSKDLFDDTEFELGGQYHHGPGPVPFLLKSKLLYKGLGPHLSVDYIKRFSRSSKHSSSELKYTFMLAFASIRGAYTYQCTLLTNLKTNTERIEIAPDQFKENGLPHMATPKGKLPFTMVNWKPLVAVLSWKRRLAPRDFAPSFGQKFVFTHALHLLSRTQKTAALLQCFMPGLFKHHSLQFIPMWSHVTSPGVAQYSILPKPKVSSSGHCFLLQDLTIPRNVWNYIAYASAHAVCAYLAYTLPVCYPDIALGSLIYFKRLRATFLGSFYKDLVKGPGHENKLRFDAISATLATDFSLLRGRNFNATLGGGIIYDQQRILDPLFTFKAEFLLDRE